MNKSNWQQFKRNSEKAFEKKELQECWGFQIQPGTKWRQGLDHSEISNLEKLFGFEFPIDYCEMLSTMNGFDRDAIAIDPDKQEDDRFERVLYQYPDDFILTKWLTEEIHQHRSYVNEVLSPEGYDVHQIVGFIPLYSHRSLVVFSDKKLSPVISVHQGTDIIIYGHSLLNYWEQEFELKNHWR